MSDNTIYLRKGEEGLTRDEYKRFKKGDTIIGIDSCSEVLKTFSIEQEAEARQELAKYRCSYSEGRSGFYIEEYALEFCETDEDGDFIEGSDYQLAEEAED